MKTLKLKFTTESDAAFGRGDGVAGVVDSEVQHDKYGIPFMGGRTLKGMLGEECANILFSLEMQNNDATFKKFNAAAARLFGLPGSSNNEKSILHVADAQIPDDVRAVLIKEVKNNKLMPQQVLAAFCAIRRQTAIDPKTSAPKKGSLYNVRVILRETPFESELSFIQDSCNDDLALLSACIKAFRRAGTDRNRGKGKIKQCKLFDKNDEDVTDKYFDIFVKEVGK